MISSSKTASRGAQIRRKPAPDFPMWASACSRSGLQGGACSKPDQRPEDVSPVLNGSWRRRSSAVHQTHFLPRLFLHIVRLPDKVCDIVVQLLQRIFVRVHHVSGGIVAVG